MFAIILNRCYIKRVNKKGLSQSSNPNLYKKKATQSTTIEQPAISNCIIQCFADIVNVSDFESLGDKLSRQY
jgi:retron-type reverse transcriptase